MFKVNNKDHKDVNDALALNKIYTVLVCFYY